jgi:hypothetical protein
MTYHYTFKDCLQRAERISWRVEDLIGPGKTLDFSRPFMPEGLAWTASLDFLSEAEKRTLNQIRGHAYLAIFGLVEEFILPFVLDHVRPSLSAEDDRTRALLEFASEEAKHIRLFRAFGEAFAEGFGTPCDVIGPPEAIAAHVLAQSPLSVALLILHIEWMTQEHYLESVKGDETLDPLFKDLLLHHWMEEHQHAQLDTLMVRALAEGLSQSEIDAAIEGYVALGGFLDDGLRQQASFDIAALEQATGRTFSASEREVLLRVQHQANRWTYIGSGMAHRKFLSTVGELSPHMRQALEAAAPGFS